RPLTDFGGKTSIFSHPVYLFLREFSLQDFRGGSPNTLYLTQSCVEKFGSQLEAQDLFNKLPQYLVNSGAVINTKCHAFNMPTLLAASDRAKVDIERIINNLKEAGNL
ncbi:hypothetical protein ACRWEY_18735, partial [Escherichia coli]